MTVNVKAEIQEHISAVHTTYGLHVKCIECFIHNPDLEDEEEFISQGYLPCGFDDKIRETFYNDIDVDYDDYVHPGYDINVEGCIWWSDGSWSMRDIDEDSRCELWIFCKTPIIPSYLKCKSTSNVVSLFEK